MMSVEHPTITRRIRRVITDLIVFLSFAAICVAMIMTVGDVVIRLAATVVGATDGVRPRWGILGLVDLTQLAIMAAVPLAIASAFFLGTHIHVDLFYNGMSLRLQRFASVIAGLIGAALMGLCLWTAWREMIGQLDFTTTSATLGIAYTWYWAPLIAGLALSMLGCIWTIFCPPHDTEQKINV